MPRVLEELPWKTFLVDRASLEAGFLVTMPLSVQVVQVQAQVVLVLPLVGCVIFVICLVAVEVEVVVG